eukprot:TRINITY_DN1685_c0_g1_i2.p1 TRINITY_DN1685_c0_g1~~TRINITY_DN1685_c0_g1_i2.p1  ORF type:complete len:575 (+),score=101.00 TRINITY_DN1685_c0_g1_i2:107-1831(+)
MGSRWGRGATLEGIRQDLSRIAEEKDWDHYHTPRNLMLALQKEVSNLAEIFQWRPDVATGLSGWTESEKSHVAGELSEVLAYTIRLADKCGVDVEGALSSKLQQGYNLNGVSRSGSINSQGGTRPSDHHRDDRSSNNTSQRIHRGERPQPLDGASLRRLERESVANKRPAFKRTLSVVCDYKDPTTLYSPTHFNHGLFSPVTNRKDFDVEYNTGEPLLPTSLSKSSLGSVPVSPLSPKSLDNFPAFVDTLAHGEYSDAELRKLDVMWCAPYNGRIVDLVKNGRDLQVTAEQLPQFVRLVKDLQQQGSNFVAPLQPDPVVKPAVIQPKKNPIYNNANDKPKQSAKPKKKRIARTLSVQLPHSKWDANSAQECFSPTHFDHDLFSPTTKQTDFDIDYSHDGVATLPPSLSQKNLKQAFEKPSQHADESDHHRNSHDENAQKRLSPVHNCRRYSVASLGSEDEEVYRGLDLLIEVAEESRKQEKRETKDTPKDVREYLDRNLLPAVLEIESMLAQNEINAQEIEQMDLTFCVPADGKVVELIPEGRHVPVTVDRLPEFIRLAKQMKLSMEEGRQNGN